ncbi:MAG: 50S ribosomal protein L25/general stress protein Ctc, partial [Deltaproteobacteria bacterium]|nr:50S ribosomal protein L25/general stress protein Ctc [Deltaproteobacteria bacterium]
MAQSTLNVLKRKRMGKSGAREIRKEGNIPAVLYGKGTETLSLVINPSELKEALSTAAGENTLLEIRVKDGEEDIKKLSLLREIQYDFLTSKPIHLDFQALDMDQKITVSVPVQIEGKSIGVKEGGILEEILREISVECLPTDIPNSFIVDVSELEVGHSIHVNVLEIKEGISILHEQEDTILTVLAPKVEVVEIEEVEGEEGVEGAEGAEE